jgi:hypothetical protein
MMGKAFGFRVQRCLVDAVAEGLIGRELSLRAVCRCDHFDGFQVINADKFMQSAQA